MAIRSFTAGRACRPAIRIVPTSAPGLKDKRTPARFVVGVPQNHLTSFVHRPAPEDCARRQVGFRSPQRSPRRPGITSSEVNDFADGGTGTEPEPLRVRVSCASPEALWGALLAEPIEGADVDPSHPWRTDRPANIQSSLGCEHSRQASSRRRTAKLRPGPDVRPARTPTGGRPNGFAGATGAAPVNLRGSSPSVPGTRRR